MAGSAAPMTHEADGMPALLGPADPPPFAVTNAGGRGCALLVCDHASNRMPTALGTLGLAADRLQEHIAWDIGAAAAAQILSARFDAPLVETGYSRLAIDCNRDISDPTSIPEVSDDVPIPGNRRLDKAEAAARADRIMAPYHAEIERLLDLERDLPFRALVSIHSFTPVFGGRARPWHVGALWNRDGRLALPFMAALAARGDVTVGDNEPYSARGNVGYTVRRHGELRGLPHLLIEIRQDLIAGAEGAIQWSGIVGDALGAAFDSLPP